MTASRTDIFNWGFIVSIALLPLSHRLSLSILFVLSLVAFFVIKPAEVKSFLHTRFSFLSLIVLFSIPLVYVIGMGIHEQFNWRIFDNPSRFLFAVPLMLFSFAIKLHKIRMLKAIFFALVLSGLMALIALFLSVDAWLMGAGFGRSRVVMSYGNAIPYANVLAGLLLLCAAGVLNELAITKHTRFLSLVAFLMGIFTLILNGTSGVWLGLGAFFFYWLFKLSYPLGYKALLSAFIFGCVMFNDWILGQVLIDKVFALHQYLVCYFTSENVITCGAENLSSRLVLWSVAWGNFVDSPLLGVGPVNHLETIKAASEFYGVAALKSYSHSHSDFFNLSSQFGLLGVGAFGLTFIAPIIIGQGLKKDHFWRALAVVLALGFLLSGLSQTTLAHSSTASFYAFFMAIIMGQLLRSFKN